MAVSYFSKSGMTGTKRSKFWDGSTTTDANRAVFAGGNNPGGGTYTNIYYTAISTTGNTTSFGSLTTNRSGHGGCGSLTRGLFIAGATGVGGFGAVDSIEYVTIQTAGNATSFGTLSSAMAATDACSNQTRALQGGGEPSQGSNDGNIRYLTIATTGNSTSFGTLTARRWLAACASPTRGIFASGYTSGNSNLIEYVTIATTGNAVTFGSLTYSQYASSAASSEIRGLIGNNSAGYNYITIATTGNGTNFGNLTSAKSGAAGAANQTRALFAAGYDTANSSAIDYFTIATTGNAVSFGTYGVSTNEAAGTVGS
jgi:hypothetical protein